MNSCPGCGVRLWPTAFRPRAGQTVGAFAAARWACDACGWSSPIGASDRDVPAQVETPTTPAAAPDRPASGAPIRVAVISRSHIVRGGLVNLVAQLKSRAVITEAVEVDDVLEPHDVAIYDLGAVSDVDRYHDLSRLLHDGVQVIGLVYDAGRPTLAPVAGATSHVLTLSATPDQLLKVLQETTPTGRILFTGDDADRLPAGITTQEFRVMELIGAGLSNDDIAKELYVSINTVKTYIRTCYRRIGVTDRSGAILWAMRHGVAGGPDRR